MSPDFVAAVIDTLLPGDADEPRLPSASSVDVMARLGPRLEREHRATLAAIADAAGGEDAFLGATESIRIEAIRRVDVAMRSAFQALVQAALIEYYESDAVLLAFGWRVEPPQPSGHRLDAFDETLLEPVKRRGPMWR
jgi:hypothetical protein